MQMRQKNLFIIIVLPTIYLLDKYMALFRTQALIHIYENKGVRGYFRVFNYAKKKQLILKGAKTMSYRVKGLHTRFKGRFYGKFVLGGPEVDAKYRKQKEEALSNSEKTSMTSAQVRYREQRDLIIYLFRKTTKMSYHAMANQFLDYDFEITFQQVAKICSKFGDTSDIKLERDAERLKNAQNEQKSPENTDSEQKTP